MSMAALVGYAPLQYPNFLHHIDGPVKTEVASTVVSDLVLKFNTLIHHTFHRDLGPLVH